MILPISIAFWNQRPTINQDLDRWRRAKGKRDSFLKLETRLWMHRYPALIDASSFRGDFGKKTKFFPDFLPDNN
jgi:hypothetical protein